MLKILTNLVSDVSVVTESVKLGNLRGGKRIKSGG